MAELPTVLGLMPHQTLLAARPTEAPPTPDARLLSARQSHAHTACSACPCPYPTLPYPALLCSAASGAAWDTQSVGVLMHLARALPSLTVQLERGAGSPPLMPTPSTYPAATADADADDTGPHMAAL